jgi:hypothetical protein
MLLISCRQCGLIGIMSMFLLFGEVGCSMQTQLPQQLEFRFGRQFELKKLGEYVAITRFVEWGDAQRSSGPDFDATPKTVLITMPDLALVWDLMKRIDFARLNNPSDRDFEKTSPDQSHFESVRLVVDGKVIVEWERDYQILIKPLREPFVPLLAMMDQIYRQREEALVMPQRLELALHRGRTDYLLVKSGATGTLEIAGKTSVQVSDRKVSVRAEDFVALWKTIVNQKVMNRSFAASEPEDSAIAQAPPFAIRLRVDGAELLNVRFSESAPDKAYLDVLWDGLDMIWRGSYRQEGKGK